MTTAAGPRSAEPSGRRRRPRLGLRREVEILLPAALLLLLVLSTFTLAAYYGSISRLVEERQAEAARLAGAAADRLASTPQSAGVESLRDLAPTARGIYLLDAAGAVLGFAGEPPPPAPLSPLTPNRPPAHPLGLGPDGETLPDAVAGFASWEGPLGRRYVRLDLPAEILAGQSRSVRLLAVVVLSVNGALVLLVLLFLRRLLEPYELMLQRARQVTGEKEAAGDEVELMLSAFERAAAALADPPAGDDDFAALERALARSLQSGLLLLDREGRVLSLNEVGRRLLGITEIAPAAPLREVLAAQPELRDLLAGAVADGRASPRQECAVRTGGEVLTLGLTVHPLRRDDGGARGFLVLFADLTAVRRRAEESRLADHLTRLAEMAGGVAHELRNSLATLRGYLTLIERRPDEDSIADFLSEIRLEADHLERVLDDFLSFARPGSARMQDLSLVRLAERAAADPVLAGVAVEVTGPATGEALLRGDSQLLERALRNLLHNAAQAQREAGREGPIELRIEARKEPQAEGFELTVEDRGPGLPPEIRERLFHPFATGRRGGVGLGLALTHRIVVLHGGRIRLEDRQGGGTRAVLFFPAELPGDTTVTESYGAAMGPTGEPAP